MKGVTWVHFCGDDGCESVGYDVATLEAMRVARLKWCDEHKAEHGEFPDTEAQLEWMDDWIEVAERRAEMRRSAG